MIEVPSVFNTRPEAVKIAPVFFELKKHSKQIISYFWVAARRQEMLERCVLGCEENGKEYPDEARPEHLWYPA